MQSLKVRYNFRKFEENRWLPVPGMYLLGGYARGYAIKTQYNVYWQSHLQENSINELKRLWLQFSIIRIYSIQDCDFKADVFWDHKNQPWEYSESWKIHSHSSSVHNFKAFPNSMKTPCESPGGTTKRRFSRMKAMQQT